MRKLIFSMLFMSALANARSTEIIAHRGGTDGAAPENSIEAFTYAWQNGAKYVEGDFWLTKSGEMVCVHGRNELKALSEFDRDIPDISAKDLGRINLAKCGRWGDKFAFVKLPTMDEVFASLPNDGVLVFEIKNYGEGYAETVETARAKAGIGKERLVIIAFNAEYLKDACQKVDASAAYWLYVLESKGGKLSPDAETAIKKCAEIGADGVNLGNTELLTKEYVDAVHAAGLKVAVWTVNDIEEAKRLKSIGVDFITTDRFADLKRELR